MKGKSTITIEGDGFLITACRGASGCERRSLDAPELAYDIEKALTEVRIGERLRERLGRPLRAHNIIKVAISYCPNACGRSQIADVGLIAACMPEVTPDECSACGMCAEVCKEDAVRLDSDGFIRFIDPTTCLGCGDCIADCPTQAIERTGEGFRLMLGGKLGRHPQFAEELPGLKEAGDVPKLIAGCVERYLKESTGHERLGEVVARIGANALYPGE